MTAAAGERLAGMIADLDGYIERRAAELAAPVIEDVRAGAMSEVRAARQETQRQRDLVAELRRRIAVLERHLARATGKEPR